MQNPLILGLFDLHSTLTYFENNKILINIYQYYIAGQQLQGLKKKMFYTSFKIFWSKKHDESKTKANFP